MTAVHPRPLLTRRLRRVDLIVLDVLAALGLAVICGYAAADPPAATGYPDPLVREPIWISLLFMAVVSAPIAVRRRWPLPVLAVVTVGAFCAVLVEVVPVYASVSVFIAVAFALYQVALTAELRRSVPALLLVLAGAVVAVFPKTSDWDEAVTGVAFLLLLLTATWILGRAVRERRAYASRSAAELARQATVDERLRISRELHDIVAHSMSVITVKAAVANHVAESRPQEVRDALRDIEATSRSALAELRRTLGVLRAGTPGTPVEFGPAPGLAELPDLLKRATAAGTVAELALELPAGAEPPEDVGRSVYRIVQEALTNVVKHAGPVRCRVAVTGVDGELRVEVTNEPGRPVPPVDPKGQGLIGMRERAHLYGGTVEAGPAADGGFRLSARLPYRPAGRPPVDPALPVDPVPAADPVSSVDPVLSVDPVPGGGGDR
ncbi:sensor histidine kinase [Plantactinospora sp. B6F1]|uniref:sensor histidine kinase n=1 Tax=Plantactinospora sp. B6F1 TaxID=3158971 RepID=UPI0032D9A67F